MRRALIVVSLVAAIAGGFVAILTGSGTRAIAGTPVAHQRAFPRTAPGPVGPITVLPGSPTLRRLRRGVAPSIQVGPSVGGTCFVGGTSCSLTPCTELIGAQSAVAVSPGSEVAVPAPTTPRPTANCAHRPLPRTSVPVTASAVQVTAGVTPASPASAAQLALPRLRQLLARRAPLRSASGRQGH